MKIRKGIFAEMKVTAIIFVGVKFNRLNTVMKMECYIIIEPTTVHYYVCRGFYIFRRVL